MNIKLTNKIIKEMCGTVSFKRGESFFHAHKVKFESYHPNECKATVIGSEDFYVTILKNTDGEFRSRCSCPKLASFDKECQHVAAVLLAVYEHQRLGTSPLENNASTNQTLADDFFTLFNNEAVRSSGHQLHFENRQVLETEFICKPVTIGNGLCLLGIEIIIGQSKVGNIRDFLEMVKDGIPYHLSPAFTYNQKLHCFDKESNTVIQQLIQVCHDEKMYFNTIAYLNDDEITSKQMLFIPPSSFIRLLPFLIKAPLVKLQYNGYEFAGFQLSQKALPLIFFIEEQDKGYILKIEGLNQIVILNSYHSVLLEGKLIKLESKDSDRLSDLRKMIETSETNQIPIPNEKIGFFLEKVVPGLRNLGKVTVSRELSNLYKTPLIAKLFLDRVKNRLLAGLEFHYGKIVINPLENIGLQGNFMLVRDMETENEILKLMEDSSFTKTDGGYYLHNDALEYEFLYHTLQKLKKLVQIYATTAVRSRIFRGNAHPQIRVKINKERTNWLEFKFELDGIRDEQIKEVLVALEEKRKYYRLRNGSLLSLETKEFDEIKRFLHTPLLQNHDISDGLKLPIEQCLQLLDHVDGSDIFKLESSFRQFLENIHSPDRLNFSVPKSLESILKDYQKQGFQWMKTLAHYGFGGILADDMGLGKTLQSITFIMSVLPEIRKKKCLVLIVCPSSLTYNWLGEMMKFAPQLNVLVLDGSKTERVKLQKDLSDIDVVITSYPLLRTDIKWYEKQTFHTVIFDEAQAFKNPVTQTARAVKRIQADYRFALTGTPVENSLVELWSIFHVVFPELFLGLKEYSKLTRKTIARRIRPFLLRRMKEDVLSEFPEKIESVETVELLPDQKKLYTAYLAKLRHDTLKHLDKDTIRKNRIKILAGLTRLRQICCHPVLFVDGYKGSSAKFEQLLQIIDEAKFSGRRVLIFSQFTKMLDLIGRELVKKGLAYFYLDGATPSEERVEICHRYNSGERDFFLISLKAGGTGLNLMSADTVILFDTWWNPAVEEQASDRAHRIGQKNDVQVIKLVARGTIEEKMNELQDKKRHLIEEIINSDGQSLAALSEEDLKEILMI